MLTFSYVLLILSAVSLLLTVADAIYIRCELDGLHRALFVLCFVLLSSASILHDTINSRLAGEHGKTQVTRLLATGAAAEQTFYAAHGQYGTVGVDLALDHPALRRLDDSHRLTAEIGLDGQAVKLTATVDGVNRSRFLRPPRP